MSCLSLPKSAAGCDEPFEPEEPSWPAIVQGVRVYARRQPPKVANELLGWADLFDGFASLTDDAVPA
jgi:hypothetical protein